VNQVKSKWKFFCPHLSANVPPFCAILLIFARDISPPTFCTRRFRAGLDAVTSVVRQATPPDRVKMRPPFSIPQLLTGSAAVFWRRLYIALNHE
jgi:hypothetical protein